MNLKKHLPNALTCCNLLCGCLGILYTFQDRLDLVFYFVLAAAVFDFFDGFAARILNVSSPIGKDLDSLADMVTFGVLPGFIIYRMLSMILLADATMDQSPVTILPAFTIVPFIGLVIPVCSALRLAKFNNDARQSDGFIGVNTPANTLLIGSLGYILVKHGVVRADALAPHNLLLQLLHNQYALSALTLFMSFLLVSELPIFALKFKNFSWTDNKLRYLFLIIALVLLILFQLFAFPFIIFLYILLSVIHNIVTSKQKTNS